MCDSEVSDRVHTNDALELGQLDAVVFLGLQQFLWYTVIGSGEVEHLDIILTITIAKEIIQVVRVWISDRLVQSWYVTPGTDWPS